MKAKADKKARKTGLTSVESVIQPSYKKVKKTTVVAAKKHQKQSEIEIHNWLHFNADKVGDIIKQLENIQRQLLQVASLARAHYILK